MSVAYLNVIGFKIVVDCLGPHTNNNDNNNKDLSSVSWPLVGWLMLFSNLLSKYMINLSLPRANLGPVFDHKIESKL